MSWAEPVDDMDTLSELPPPSSRTHGTSSRGRSKMSASAMGGGSKSERRLLMEAKATISAAIAEERRERLMAKRRARKCVSFLYYTFKVVGVAACVYTSGLNVTFVYMRPDVKLQDRLIRCYLVLFGIGGVLAELDTPFAKSNFRALQKWWFKAPFYVFMAWLCFDAKNDRGTLWFSLELVAFVALQAMAVMAVVLNVCLREVLERSGALGKRKKARRQRGGKSMASSRGRDGGGNRSRAPGGARVASSVSGGLGVSSFRDRDRRRPRASSAAAPSPGVASSTGSVQGGGSGDRSAPEMVPETSGRLLSPGNAYGGDSKFESYGSIENGGGGGGAGTGRGVGGGTISGRIKWWLEGDEEEESPRGQAEGESEESSMSPASVSTARSSGRGNWWEDSDGDDGSSSMASFALRDDASDAESVASGFSSVSAGVGSGRFVSSTYHGRGTAPMRQAAGVSSRRSARGGSGSGGGAPGGSAAGSGQHVALTAQALARNSNDPPQGTGRGLGFVGVGGGSNYVGSVHGGSVAGSSTGGFGGGGSLRSFGGGRAGRRSAREALGGPRRASSVSGDGLRAGGASWVHGGLEHDLGRTVSEAGGDDRTEDYRYSRGGTNGNSRRTPDIVDFSPF